MERAPVAIVTAGIKRIGAAIAPRLPADGHPLVPVSGSGAAEQVADELGAVGLTGSVTSPEDLGRLVETAVEGFGQLDAVVNNSGCPLKVISSRCRTKTGTQASTCVHGPVR